MPSIVPDSFGMQHKYIHVAVGVVTNSIAEVLITRRSVHTHQGSLWEFPGGKLERNEDCFTALQRELKEEVGISINSAVPLIQIPFRYPDKSVLLDVFLVTHFTGRATAMEGQGLQWVAVDDLDGFHFPAANRAIINSIRLPDQYLITGKFVDKADFLSRLDHALQQGIKLVQLRAGNLPATELTDLARAAKALCDKHQARVLINANAELAKRLGVGLHLNSQQLQQYEQRPVEQGQWLSASVHNEMELQQANKLGVDFIVLSPVLPTPSHPGAAGLGWENFASLVSQCPLPVYALGGVSGEHMDMARQSGAQGIAAISAFWVKPCRA